MASGRGDARPGDLAASFCDAVGHLGPSCLRHNAIKKEAGKARI